MLICSFDSVFCLQRVYYIIIVHMFQLSWFRYGCWQLIIAELAKLFSQTNFFRQDPFVTYLNSFAKSAFVHLFCPAIAHSSSSESSFTAFVLFSVCRYIFGPNVFETFLLTSFWIKHELPFQAMSLAIFYVPHISLLIIQKRGKKLNFISPRNISRKSKTLFACAKHIFGNLTKRRYKKSKQKLLFLLVEIRSYINKNLPTWK